MRLTSATPVMIPHAERGHLPALEFLLIREANCGTSTASGSNALYIAVLAGKDEALAELLKQTNIDINSGDNLGNAALRLAANNGHLKAVHRLLDNGADPRTANQQGWNALHAAACSGHVAVVETLINSENEKDFIDATTPMAMHPCFWLRGKARRAWCGCWRNAAPISAYATRAATQRFTMALASATRKWWRCCY